MTLNSCKKTTRISIGSCIFPNLDKSILKDISLRDPDLFILTGDATYLDYKSIDLYSNLSILKGHFIGVSSNIGDKTELEIEEEWRSIWDMTVKDKNWLSLKQKTEIISVWDDHDYGQNDGTFNNKYRELAKKLYLNAMDIDSNDERRTRDGVYYYYPFKIKLNNEISKTIDIILLDSRYFAKEDGDENILGNKQWLWLEDILRNKLHGDLTLIISGIQMIPISRKKTSETWSRFAESQRRLFKLINEIKTDKQQEIILISGDVHRGEIMKIVCNYGGTYYPEFTEVTSSGLTHSVGDEAPFLIRNFVRMLHMIESDGISECLWRGINFGEIDIEWDNDLHKIKNININILDAKMNVKCSSRIKPMINNNKQWFKQLEGKQYAPLLQTDDLVCYGANKQYTKNQKYWKQITFDSLYVLITISPVFIIAVLYQCVKCLCLKKSKQKIA